MPGRFFEHLSDLKKCDLLIVMGTSLTVNPFASLIDRVPSHVPRLLINRELCGIATSDSDGFDFEEDTNYGDVYYLGDCDAGVKELARLSGMDLE